RLKSTPNSHASLRCRARRGTIPRLLMGDCSCATRTRWRRSTSPETNRRLLLLKNPLRLVRHVWIVNIHVDYQFARTRDRPFPHDLSCRRTFLSFSSRDISYLNSFVSG